MSKLTAPKDYQKVRLILGDQLNASHQWFKTQDDDVLYVMAELRQETDYAVHHIQKVIAFFAAMDAFANALESAGHQVMFLTLDDTECYQSLPELLLDIMEKTNANGFEYMQPDEYRLALQLQQFSQAHDSDCVCVDSEHFYLPFDQLHHYVDTGRHMRMEFFYRRLRKQFDVLMEGEQPIGGQWNFDQENRKKLTNKDIAQLPQPLVFDYDIRAIEQRLARHKIKTIGRADNFYWPVSRKQSYQLLAYFCQYLLPNFGRFQDAMVTKTDLLQSDVSWSLYHSRLSFSLNTKMLSPKVVVDTAVAAYHADRENITIAQVEGFVRQILGWREFVRAVYWRNMPNYAQLNHLEAKTKLPNWFWTGDTKMNCLHHAISQSLEYGYAHHIQRLMITGNFCLIAGIDPDMVDQWYLGIYVDAIEWVEMPNTRGMSQFADGGIVGSKAYAASGNYVSKMSNYCRGCVYDVKAKTGANACPLNSLYWHFMLKHQEEFSRNPRNAMVYRNWQKQPEDKRMEILAQAEQCLIDIEVL